MSKIFLSAVIFFFIAGGVLVYEATRTTSSLILLPADVRKRGANVVIERIRVRGKVADPIDYQLEPELKLAFRVQDPEQAQQSIQVIYLGLKPDMFAAGRDVLVDGDYANGTLTAIKVLTQCPSKYEPASPDKTGSK